jgi:hypothetical protein
VEKATVPAVASLAVFLSQHFMRMQKTEKNSIVKSKYKERELCSEHSRVIW